jgi:hypothetical protein
MMKPKYAAHRIHTLGLRNAPNAERSSTCPGEAAAAGERAPIVAFRQWLAAELAHAGHDPATRPVRRED